MTPTTPDKTLYRIKPLAWEKTESSPDYEYWLAKGGGRQWGVYRCYGGWYWKSGDGWWEAASLDDGKAKVEADYREAILERLEPVGVTAEALAGYELGRDEAKGEVARLTRELAAARAEVEAGRNYSEARRVVRAAEGAAERLVVEGGQPHIDALDHSDRASDASQDAYERLVAARDAYDAIRAESGGGK